MTEAKRIKDELKKKRAEIVRLEERLDEIEPGQPARRLMQVLVAEDGTYLIQCSMEKRHLRGIAAALAERMPEMIEIGACELLGMLMAEECDDECNGEE